MEQGALRAPSPQHVRQKQGEAIDSEREQRLVQRLLVPRVELPSGGERSLREAAAELPAVDGLYCIGEHTFSRVTVHDDRAEARMDSRPFDAWPCAKQALERAP